jgi:hypothetical protein
MNYRELPDKEEEILRHLYACDLDSDNTYGSIRYKNIYRDNHFPIEHNEDMRILLNCGGIYVHGRDKSFRPIVIFNL